MEINQTISPAALSAEHFGVKLRKTVCESEETKTAAVRRSVQAGPPKRCEARAILRKSAAAAVNLKVDTSKTVSVRQEAAEKQAIERQKRVSLQEKSSDKLDSRNRRSLDSKLGKQNYGNKMQSRGSPTPCSGLTKSSSFSTFENQPMDITSLASNTTEANHPQKPESIAEVNCNTSIAIWREWLLSTYEVCKPVIDSISILTREFVQNQINFYMDYYQELLNTLDAESRNSRQMRLLRRFSHGHRFLRVAVSTPTWCDLCVGTLWGSCTICLQCIDCKYKCHDDCESLITGQCAAGAENSSLSKIPSDCMDDTDSGYSGTPPGGTAGFTLTKEEICSRIITYNEKIGSSKGAMTLPAEDSGVFQGSIQVFINIDRPINMSLSSRPASIYDALQTPYKSPESTTSPELLPKNAVMSLHISSDNTASDVVGILLKKFKITDNPRSFALFEQTIENEKEIKLRKIGDQEKPLLNFLRWSTECKEVKRFVLKENDSGEIMYEAFSIPELYNFLAMLDKEKTLFHTEIQNKYAARRTHIAQRLREMQESPQVVKTSR